MNIEVNQRNATALNEAFKALEAKFQESEDAKIHMNNAMANLTNKIAMLEQRINVALIDKMGSGPTS